MTMGERISKLRNEKGYTQEYIASQLDISRQAVHKWEKNESRPETDNLIVLADILGTTVEYLAVGNNEKTPVYPSGRKKLPKIRTYIITIILTAAITFVATVLYIANAPVSFDAGACGGGFATAVFDQYASQLIEDNYFYLTKDYSGTDKEIQDILPVRESRDVYYEGKAIYLSFDAEYISCNSAIDTVRLRFVGERKWIQNYDWTMIK